MANLISSRFEFHAQDTGYVIRTDRYDDDTEGQTMVAVAGGPAEVANYASLLTKLQNARSGVNQTYLALANPTNAQNAAQVTALTRQVNALIYLLLHELTGLATIPGT